MSGHGLPEGAILPSSREEWRAWLQEHHQRSKGVWLVRYKKGVGLPSVTLDEAIEEALCFGWIDSLPRRLDERRTMLYFAPRKPGSNWSRLNRDRVAQLSAAGRMTHAGQRKVDAARTDGSWSALDAVDRLEVPEDLSSAFRQHPGARVEWDAFPPSTRRGILEWILNAKRPETRAKRIRETAELAQRGERANQWPRRS